MDIQEAKGVTGEGMGHFAAGGASAGARSAATVLQRDLSGDRHTPTLCSTNGSAMGVREQEMPPRRPQVEARREARRKADIAVYWALRKSEESLDAAVGCYDDFAARMNALYNARDALQEAWEAARSEEETLREALNILQGVLQISTKPEDLSLEEVKGIARSVARVAAANPFTADALCEILHDLERSGLKPFAILH